MLAEKIGIYFDGVSKGIDCDCCGDRWYSVNESEGNEELMLHGIKLKDYYKKCRITGEAIIHYLNGEKKYIVFEKFETCSEYKDMKKLGKEGKE